MGDEVKQIASSLLELMELCKEEGQLLEAMRRADTVKAMTSIDKKIKRFSHSIAEHFQIIRVNTLKLEQERNVLQKSSKETQPMSATA